LHTYLLYCVVTYKHHQNNTCVTLFAVAAVMLKPFTQRLAMFNAWRCLCLSPAATSLGMLLVRLEIIATTYRSTIFKTYAFSLYSHLCIYVSISLPIYTSVTPESPYTCLRSLMTYLEAVIERVQICTWRPRSSELRDALGGRDDANMKAVIERVWRYTWWL